MCINLGMRSCIHKSLMRPSEVIMARFVRLAVGRFSDANAAVVNRNEWDVLLAGEWELVERQDSDLIGRQQ